MLVVTSFSLKFYSLDALVLESFLKSLQGAVE